MVLTTRKSNASNSIIKLNQRFEYPVEVIIRAGRRVYTHITQYGWKPFYDSILFSPLTYIE